MKMNSSSRVLFNLQSAPPVSPAWKKNGSVAPRSAGRDSASLRSHRVLPLSSLPTCKQQHQLKGKAAVEPSQSGCITQADGWLLPCQTPQRRLGSPSEAEWLPSRPPSPQIHPEPWREERLTVSAPRHTKTKEPLCNYFIFFLLFSTCPLRCCPSLSSTQSPLRPSKPW